MITANNLKKAGFVPGEKVPLDWGHWYRDWVISIGPNDRHSGEGTRITVTEVNGKFSPGHVELFAPNKYVSLRIRSVTDLLSLKNLLK